MNWKLLIGQLYDAWRNYPSQRRELSSFPPGPPIFVTGTHRSGTTWAARMLAVPGLWYVHEPFNPNKHRWHESFTYVPPEGDCKAVDQLVQQILQGRFRHALHNPHAYHPLMPMRLFPQPFRRLMIKDPIACLLTGYLARRLQCQTLVLFRHPCGFVSSVMRLGWPTAKYLRRFLNNRELMDDHLGSYADLLAQYCEKDTIESATVLHCALNTVLWNQTVALGLEWRLFESLCANPLKEFQTLFTWLGLPYDENIQRQHVHLCEGQSVPVQNYRPHEVKRNSREMAWNWKQQLSTETVSTITSLWNIFKIPLYRSTDANHG